jgi:trk system potassium uptake protein TrkA
MIMRIIIFGAGRVGTFLVKSLEEKKQLKITIIDEDKEVCEMLAAQTNVNVVHGDATDPKLLDELQLKDSSFLFSLTVNEEVNFLASVYSKQLGAEHVISRSSEPKYSKILEKLRIDPLLPEMTLARELANMVVSPVISKMLDPTYSHIDLMEKDVNSDLDGLKVADAAKKKGFVIISIYENGEFRAPGPRVELKKGMKIVVLKYNQ